ncbi:MAG: glycosyltransferase family 4 protein [Planctomycetota bacterium]
MKVGIDIGSSVTDPKSGGQFTLTAEIVGAFRRLVVGRASRHEYLLLHSGPGRVIDQAVEYVALDDVLSARRGVARFVGRVVRKASAGRIGWFRDPTRCERIEKVVRDRAVDLVWSISPTAAIKAPFVSTVWDLDHRTTPFFPEVSVTGFTWEAREALYSESLPRSAYVITGTETGKRAIGWFYGIHCDRIKVIPFPTPSFALTGEVAADDAVFDRLSLRPEAPYIFYPAQFWPHKNHVNLVRALKAMGDRGLGTHRVVFCGSDKGNLGYVKRFVETAGLADRVCFAGFVTIGELIALYRRSRALVFPSYMGFDNLPPLEAMGLGCPCIVSDIPGHHDQFGEAALYFAPNDPAAIAARVVDVESDTQLRDRLVERGRIRAAAWRADDYVAAIDECVDEFANYRINWPSGDGYRHT